MRLSTTRTVRWRRPDPVIAALAAIAVGTVLWCCVSLASGTTSSSTGRVDVGVDTVLQVAPTLTRGDSRVQLSDLFVPGQQRNASSDDWSISTNYPLGFHVNIRSTTSPAMQGRNAAEGAIVRESFSDFSRSGDPIAWDASDYTKAVFGYSLVLDDDASSPAVGADKWSSGSKWRGFDDSAYELFETGGGSGTYAFDLKLRTELSAKAAQRAGTYRANLILSVVPGT